MEHSRSGFVLVAGLVVLAGLASATAAGGVTGASLGGDAGDAGLVGAGDATQAGLGGDAQAQAGFDPDSVSMQVDLASDGDADWAITYRIQLDDANATAAFESVRAELENDSSPYRDRFRDRMERTARAAENATGRAMSVENVTVEAARETLPQEEYGVVTYRFTWTNFGVADGEELRAGDAIDQLYLEDDTSLTVTWPSAYSLASHTPEATTVAEGSVTWQGQTDFDAGEPSVVLEPASESGGIPLVVVGIVVAVLLVGAWLVFRRGVVNVPFGGGEGEDEGSPAASSASGGNGGDSDADGAASGPDEPPEELLSNEERVLRLLEERGGRMKQGEVAEELDWTAAKTSQVVGDLREADDLESFRLGRENVLTLPDVSIEPGSESEAGSEE